MSDFEFDLDTFLDPEAFLGQAGQNQTNATVTGEERPLKTTGSEKPPRSTLNVMSISDAAMNSAVFKPAGAVADIYNRVGQDAIAMGIAENGGPTEVLGGALPFAPTDLILKAETLKGVPQTNDFSGLGGPGGGAAEGSPGAQPIDPGGASVSGQGWALPTNAPPRVTSRFGPRKSPGGVGSTNHKGIDLDGEKNDPIKASRAGTVTIAGSVSGYGNSVYIDHGGGYISRYAHMTSLNCKVGDKVMMNQVVGFMGATGNVTGVHLHFEIRKDGVALDPGPLLGV